MARSKDQFMPDFKNWFQNTKAGTSLDWGGGKLTRTADGAQYALPEWEGQENEYITFNQNSDPVSLAKAYKGIQETWDKQYGEGWESAAADFAHSYKSQSDTVGDSGWQESDWSYAQQKADQINALGEDYTDYNPYNIGAGQWRAQDVFNAFENAGLTPQEHYNKYGKKEGLTWGVGKQLTTENRLLSSQPSTHVDTQNVPEYTADTVSERLNQLLSKDNPYITMARNSAVEFANQRGLQNTAMAAGSGEKAAIESALPVAQQDAQAANTLLQNEQAFNYNAALQNADQDNQFLLNQQANDYQVALADLNQRYNLDTMAAESGYNLEQFAAQHNYDIASMERTAKLNLEMAEFEAQVDEKMTRLDVDSKVRADLMTAIGQENQQYLNEFSEISTSAALEDDAKDALLSTLLDSHKASIDHMLSLSQFDFDLFPDIELESLTELSESKESPLEKMKNLALTGQQETLFGR